MTSRRRQQRPAPSVEATPEAQLASDSNHLLEEARRQAEVARVEAERQADQLDRIFEAVADALIVYDAGGTSCG